MIFLRNMPANSDRIQSVQPRFLAATASAISQYLAMADNEDIRDKLFVTSILFGVTPVHVKNMGRACHNAQIFLNVEAQALKHPQFLKKFPLKTKHSFFCCHSSFAFRCCDSR